MSTSGKSRPLVAVTIGDPAGIGPETVAKMMAKGQIQDFCIPLIVGNEGVLANALSDAGVSLDVRVVRKPAEARGEAGTVDLLEGGDLAPGCRVTGEVNAEAGRFSGDCLRRAVDLALAGNAHAVVMAPVNKAALNAGGYHFAGFREIANHMTGSDQSVQILMGRHYRLARVANHVALRDVPDLCTRENVLNVIQLLDKGLKDIGFDRPRIGVSALNPHIGEGGLMGREEIDHIIPAVEDARRQGIEALGPFPGDTVFLNMKNDDIDIVLSMHHDHGNACIKLVEFGNVVNFLAGLPIRIFTVAHGTAFDIAGKGVADETNLEWSVHAAAGVALPQ
jgi:4-phospho-D-threonate 3-dehydrogenase / 4-phospho-D-erythronate 3-dehydrogenase